MYEKIMYLFKNGYHFKEKKDENIVRLIGSPFIQS